MRATARHGVWRIGWALFVAPVVGVGALAGCDAPAAKSGPVDPAEGVALLAVVEGQVKVRREGGDEVAATADMPLVRSDTVITSPGALAVVVLANGYVIKLEEDQATPVRALAHLDDPPAREDLAELFERALGAEAFARVGGADRIERIAGWNARRAAGETPAPVARRDQRVADAAAPPPVDVRAEEAAGAPQIEAAKPVDARQAEIEADDEPDGGSPAPAKKASTQKRDTSTSAPNTHKKTTGGPVPASELPSPEAPAGAPAPQKDELAPIDLADSWFFEPVNQKAVSKVGLPALLRAQRRVLAQCLHAMGASVLRLKVVNGEIVGAELAGGKAAPGCVKSVVGEALPEAGEDGWVVVRTRK